MIRRKNYPAIKKKLWGGALWTRSYFAGSCGVALIEVIGNTLSNNKRRIEVRSRMATPSVLSFPALK
ncbi:transposase [Pseudomonas sp. UMAB-08]|uniref:transposase n=1 Tax=Pseudomonas sp. UMAB-08 TaxID=1365375 RepID=UPI0035A67686